MTVTTVKGETKQAYDILVLATGTRTIGNLPWKASLGGYEATKDILHQYRALVKSAKSIVVGGGGPTGVELAGELGFEYGRTKDIGLITSGTQLCADSLPANVAKVAEGHLKKMPVKITYGVKITGTKPTSNGKTELTLDNGETKTVDLYLPTIGMLPNSEYIPRTLLNESGYARVDQYLRVKNATDIWAVGDIVDIEPSQIVYLEKQVAAITKSLDLVLKGKQPIIYKTGGDRKSCCRPPKCPIRSAHHQHTGVLALAIGRSKATGRSGSMKLPGFLIWYMSKTSQPGYT